MITFLNYSTIIEIFYEKTNVKIKLVVKTHKYSLEIDV